MRVTEVAGADPGGVLAAAFGLQGCVCLLAEALHDRLRQQPCDGVGLVTAHCLPCHLCHMRCLRCFMRLAGLRVVVKRCMKVDTTRDEVLREVARMSLPQSAPAQLCCL